MKVANRYRNIIQNEKCPMNTITRNSIEFYLCERQRTFLRMNNRTILHSSNRCKWTKLFCSWMKIPEKRTWKRNCKNGWKWISPFFNNQWFHQMVNNSFLFWYSVTQEFFPSFNVKLNEVHWRKLHFLYHTFKTCQSKVWNRHI